MRFEEANLHKFIDFLKKMPHFTHWTKNALSRLTYYLPKRNFLRNQNVFKEGEACEHVFVVLEGEFEL
jgi:CRP-like cAMP-binding protein